MLCLQAEEIGRSLAPIPFVSSVCGYGVGVSVAGDARARAALLPAIASGSTVGVLLTEDCWREAPRVVQSSANSAYVEGVAGNVPDGAAASVALACIGAGSDAAIVQLDLNNPRVQSRTNRSICYILAQVFVSSTAKHAFW